MRDSLLLLVAVLLVSAMLGACRGGEKGTPTPRDPWRQPSFENFRHYVG